MLSNSLGILLAGIFWFIRSGRASLRFCTSNKLPKLLLLLVWGSQWLEQWVGRPEEPWWARTHSSVPFNCLYTVKQWYSHSSRGVVQTQIWGLTPRVSDSVSLEWGLRICISHRFPRWWCSGRPGTILWELLLWHILVISCQDYFQKCSPSLSL